MQDRPVDLAGLSFSWKEFITHCRSLQGYSRRRIVLKANDGGTSWTPVVTGITDNFTGMYFLDASQGWVITGIKSEYYNEMPDSGIILHSTDGGTTWVKQLTMPLTSLNDVTFVDAENGWAVGSIQASGSIIQRTTNGGTTWDQLSSDTIPAPITSIDFASFSIGWITPTSMGMSSSPWIYKTTDQGNTWSIQFFLQSGYSGYSFINDIVFHDVNDGIAVGVYRPGLVTSYALIVKTTDGGTNWTQILIDYPELNSVFLSSETEGTVVGEEGVILQTSDGGTSWEAQTSGTTNSLYNVCFTDALNGWIVGANGTILHTTNGGLTFVEGERRDEVPTDFSLDQNYPNPFNPSTTICYQLPTQSHVALKIFDVLGREVATLVNEVKQAGTYAVQWDASGLASGVYFYRLEAGNFTSVKKLLLLR